MKEVDVQYPSPGDRAQKVYAHLREIPDLTTWDILCFCVEWLGLMSPVWPWVEDVARSLARRVYYAHYVQTETVLGQDQKVRLEIEPSKHDQEDAG